LRWRVSNVTCIAREEQARVASPDARRLGDDSRRRRECIPSLFGEWMMLRKVEFVVLALGVLWPSAAVAQLNGENLLGDTGVKNGTQAAPGTYMGLLYYRYGTDTIRDTNGDAVAFDPSQPGSQTLDALMPVFVYVSPAKVLGATTE
jgi:hypothetical protein